LPVQPRKLLNKEVKQIDDEEDLEKVQFKTKLARNIHRVLFEPIPATNKPRELFMPHRMTYVVELNEEEGDDVPVTCIRSKADCPGNEVNYKFSFLVTLEFYCFNSYSSLNKI
jgi:hypothetical protein